jgi:hypothetical protein
VIVAVPAVTPVTMPVASIVARGSLLVHVPPVVVLSSVVVNPSHTASAPVMAAGNWFTVTVAVAMQPVPNV